MTGVANNPIVKALPDEWKTVGDELYQTIKLGERSTAVLLGKNAKTNSEHVVCWTGTYGTITVSVAIPMGATVKLQYDAGGSGANIDYVQVK